MGSTGRDVQILLSTFNGSRFILAQLQSLKDQDCADRISVLVRDDGSQDDTVEMVSCFDPGPLDIQILHGHNLGTKASFHELMKAADRMCTYFMFCDQDDMWDTDKVTKAVRALHGSSGPALYCGRSRVTDATLKTHGITAAVPRGPSFRNALIQNIAPGHTMACTTALLDLASESFDPQRAIMHDHWLYLVAAGFGTVVVDPQPHASYRVHETNQIGYEGGPFSRFVGRLRRVFSLDRGIYTRQDRAFCEALGKRIDAQEKIALTGFLDQKKFAHRLRYVLRCPLIHQNRLAGITANVLFLCGRYSEPM